MCEITYGGKNTTIDSSAEAAPDEAPLPPRRPQPAGTRRIRRGPSGGFHAGSFAQATTTAASAPASNDKNDDELKELLELQRADDNTDSDDMRKFWINSFGNHAANVLS
eukprot:6198336-Pleurochrysis_carterae.AAC.1